MRVAIVGAGVSGIAAAVELRRAGHDVVVLERSDDLGGVWHHNTYPGAACDVPSYLYSFTFDQRRDWTRPCSPQPEIHRYLREVAARHGVDRLVRTATEVVRADFDDAALTWTLQTGDGERIAADALVLACGQLSRPRIPAIAGASDFAGPAFHSAEWDHDADLRGRRVAVIGTGASAVQFVPELARTCARVDVYQRTAPWVLPRRNRRYAGWARRAIERLPGLQRFRRGFMLAFMESGIAGQTRLRALSLLLRAWSSWHMFRQLPDRDLRRRAWPDYPIGCKRVLFSSQYLPALGRANVELVTEPIERVTPRGVRTADGRERAVDAIVYGTGFEAHAFVAPMAVTGSGGRTLTDAWADGAQAHLGVTVAGFPNLFLLYGPNTNLGFGSIIVMVEAQVAYVRDALARLRDSGAGALDVRPEAMRASVEQVQERLRHSVWTSCRSWYRDDSGRIVNNWPGQMAEYVRLTRRLEPAEYRELFRSPAAG